MGKIDREPTTTEYTENQNRVLILAMQTQTRMRIGPPLLIWFKFYSNYGSEITHNVKCGVKLLIYS